MESGGMGVWSCCKGVNSRYLPLDKFANQATAPVATSMPICSAGTSPAGTAALCTHNIDAPSHAGAKTAGADAARAANMNEGPNMFCVQL